MANHYIAQFPGTTVQLTRSSANRTYTHVVASQGGTVERIVASLGRELKLARENLAYAEREIALIDAGTPTYKYQTRESFERARDFEAGRVARLSDPENVRALAEAEAARVVEHGWCGRPDLAQKLASQAASRGYQNVQVLPAIRTAKRAR